MTPTIEQTPTPTKRAAAKKAKPTSKAKPAPKTKPTPKTKPKSKVTKPATKAKRKPAATKAPKEPKVTRHQELQAMLQRPEGTTIKEITESFNILPHSARAMLSMAGKRLGVKIARDKETKAYRLPPA